MLVVVVAIIHVGFIVVGKTTPSLEMYLLPHAKITTP
jgi:hypothetical protein